MRLPIASMETKESESEAKRRKCKEQDARSGDYGRSATREGIRKRLDDGSPDGHPTQRAPGDNRARNTSEDPEHRGIPRIILQRGRRSLRDDLAEPRQNEAEGSAGKHACHGQSELEPTTGRVCRIKAEHIAMRGGRLTFELRCKRSTGQAAHQSARLSSVQPLSCNASTASRACRLQRHVNLHAH